MSREELELKAFDVMRLDMTYNGVSDAEIMKVIKSVSDEDLEAYIEE